MIVKIHPSYRYVVSICDSDLLGKKFEDDKKQIDLTGNFFHGDEKNEEETAEIIQDMNLEDATFTIVGKKSCEVALKIGLIEEAGIIYVSDIPVALVLL